MKITGIRELFAFAGWTIDRVELSAESSHVWLLRDGRAKLHCPHCGMVMSKSREVPRTALDLPVGICTAVTIHYNAIQGRCRACNSYSTIHPEKITNYERATYRMRRFVSQLARLMSLNRIGDLLPLSVSSIWRYDKTVLEEDVPEPDLDKLRILLIDEKAVRRGHGYVTVVINGDTGEPLYMAEGKKGISLQGFFDKLTSAQKANVQAVGIDRGGAYQKVLAEQLPSAAIVYDKFHLVANLNDVVDEVRRKAWHAAQAKDKKFIKGQRYNLFRSSENQSDDQRKSLEKLLEHNDDLNAVYWMKEAFGLAWDYTYPKAAENYLRNWVAWAEESAIPALIRFAKGIWRARLGIVSYAKHKVTSGRIEACNNQIARILHRSCGVKSIRYLFLQIRQQFLSAQLR